MADNAAWSVGSTAMTPAGCEYTSGGATAITTAHAGTVGCTTGRAIFTDKSSVAGTAITATPTAVGTLGSGNVETINAAVSPISGSVFQVQSNSANLATVANQPTNSAIGDTTSGQKGTLMFGAALTALPTATTADSWPISIVPASGGVRTDMSSVAAATVTAAGCPEGWRGWKCGSGG